MFKTDKLSEEVTETDYKLLEIISRKFLIAIDKVNKHSETLFNLGNKIDVISFVINELFYLVIIFDIDKIQCCLLGYEDKEYDDLINKKFQDHLCISENETVVAKNLYKNDNIFYGIYFINNEEDLSEVRIFILDDKKLYIHRRLLNSEECSTLTTIKLLE